MSETVAVVVSVVAALGVGGILGAYFRSVFERRREVKEQEHELKRRRYGCTLILMITKLDPETGLRHLAEIRSDLRTAEDVDKEIETELLNSVLFASDEVIESLSDFVRNPSYRSYVKAAVSMREDLWGKRTRVDEKLLNVFATERD